jgi:hypothetical protein
MQQGGWPAERGVTLHKGTELALITAHFCPL